MNPSRFGLLLAIMLLLVACQSTAQPTATLAPTAEPLPTPTTAVVETATSPTAEPTEAPTAPPPEPTAEAPTPEPTATAPATVFCPEIARPALVLSIPGHNYIVADPATGQSCDLPIQAPLPGTVQVTNEQIYYQTLEDNNMVVQRLSPDGSVEPLDFTTFDTSKGMFQTFMVSADGKYIFWGWAGAKPDDPSMGISEGWVAETATGQITAELLDFSEAGEIPHALTPARFSEDSSTFFYAHQPIGIGGAWMSFVGRYDSLYSTPSAGGAITTHFECAEQDLFLCIGDFYVLDGQLANLVYTDDKAGSVIVLTGDGQAMNTLPSDGNYIGYPTFSPTAELVYYTAELSDESILPISATIHRVAPPNAPSEVVVSDPAILLPDRFLDASRLVVGYAPDESAFGNAIVDVWNGTLEPLSEWPTATVVGVLP